MCTQITASPVYNIVLENAGHMADHHLTQSVCFQVSSVLNFRNTKVSSFYSQSQLHSYLFYDIHKPSCIHFLKSLSVQLSLECFGPLDCFTNIDDETEKNIYYCSTLF